MKPNRNKTVLLVFSLSAKIEAERKPLFGGKKQEVSTQFFDLLIKNTLEVANKSSVDVVWLDETQQHGNTFAERYTNAYKSLYTQGYTNVISIGNDTPNLTASHIQQAVDAMATKKVVFGPSIDGGIYLFGVHKSIFNEDAFKNLPWLTSKLSNKIHSLAVAKNVPFTVLETLQDIDTKVSAIEYACANPNSVLASFIIAYLSQRSKKAIKTSNNIVSSFYTSSFLRRGPPSL
ncbi:MULTISPECIES: TIGR04282 family arsenosugar biosynthesis glycosyltransferase [unclassified Cellulophaga]|uniref:TIGR04282 family arsenosugar biosynthesis glycosyltransferase n=1 Tax=unclassified Cellulophaga TaxID=2634405 RepID=UPI0026E2E39F|nr:MULTISPECIES: DUF2064 domain-containing protein [unclassified Cellulophaga]MDO6489774.1 DUF2064 domain-containing protein [Cellulophaga sp. 2_MG-2023]MDO6495032.1 DUF2064 domain-containing protein [Cellulophaga sp. 3_MG-2023]